MKKLNFLVRPPLTLVRRFLACDQGAMQVTEYLLMGTIISLGVIVGLVSYRNSLVLEYGDIATAFKRIDQSYSYTLTGGATSSFSDSDSTSHTNTINVTSPAGAGEN
ncbi:MAG: hypothetical protein ACKO2P_11750 [Planctomycetota bacterium]